MSEAQVRYLIQVGLLIHTLFVQPSMSDIQQQLMLSLMLPYLRYLQDQDEQVPHDTTLFN
jgi:hypothetical protein